MNVAPKMVGKKGLCHDKVKSLTNKLKINKLYTTMYKKGKSSLNHQNRKKRSLGVTSCRLEGSISTNIS